MITIEDVDMSLLNRLKDLRNKEGKDLKDEELLQFHVEWTNACELLRTGGNRNVKRIRLITPQSR